MTGLGKKEEDENEIKQLHVCMITDIIVGSCERQLGNCLGFVYCVVCLFFLPRGLPCAIFCFSLVLGGVIAVRYPLHYWKGCLFPKGSK